MNWDTLAADVNMILTKHFTTGRQGAKINKIVIHYNDGNLTTEGCYSVWQTRAASAHYQVESTGRIGQLVWDANTAWHAGNWAANISSIGIEHANLSGGVVSAACLDAGSHLTAALCVKYGLGRPQWDVNVFPHRRFSSTSCPGQLYGSQKDAYITRAQEWYDSMVGGSSAPAAVDPSVPDEGVEEEAPSQGATSEHISASFGGTYTCTVATLNVRDAPSTSANIVTHYSKGQTVNLDGWYQISEGLVWGRYTGSSGNVRYVCVGKATGKVSNDDYLVKGGAASASAAKNWAGAHTVKTALNVRKGPGLGYEVTGTLPAGYVLTLDGTTQEGGDYLWARYVAYGGGYRWVATKFLS